VASVQQGKNNEVFCGMDVHEMTDRELSIKIKDSDQIAFKILYLRYYDAIKRYIWYKFYLKDQVEDLVQEVFLRLWNHRENVKPDMSIKAYLYRTASNLMIDMFRKRSSKAAFLAETKSRVVHEENRLDTSLTLQKIIGGLPQKEREVLELSRFQGLKYKEIAEVFGISVKTVESRMTRAFKYLRKELGDSFIK